MEVIVACLRLYPKIWLQELSPCFGHKTQILSSLLLLVVEVTLSHGCMEVKRILLTYGKNLWVFENRMWKKISTQTRYRVRRRTHNTIFGNLKANYNIVIKLKKTP